MHSFNYICDNEYYSVIKIAPFGNKERTELIIHFDKNLKLIRNTLNLVSHRTPDTHSDFINNSMLWYNFHDKIRNLYLRENAFNDDDITKGCFYSISMLSSEESGINNLTAIVTNIEILYNK